MVASRLPSTVFAAIGFNRLGAPPVTPTLEEGDQVRVSNLLPISPPAVSINSLSHLEHKSSRVFAARAAAKRTAPHQPIAKRLLPLDGTSRFIRGRRTLMVNTTVL
jgi:hypothetical protein